MARVELRDLLEAGVHFGHQTRRWNPKMRRFIFGEREGIHIIDLLTTQRLLDQAQAFASDIAQRGGTVLFVATKKQARDAVRDVAEGAGMPYVNHRWLGGLLTNFQTISERIKRLHDLERYETEGQLALLPTRERLAAEADLTKLRANLGGVKNMKGTPNAIFIIDLKTEAIAVREAQRLRIPIIGLVDTNCDPDGIDYVIPGNDDAIRSCTIIAKAIGDVVAVEANAYRAEQERLRQEAEERARREAEERARREAEERAAAEAAAAAAAEAAAQAQAAAEVAQQQAAAAEAAKAPAPPAPGEQAEAPAAPVEAPPPPKAAPAEPEAAQSPPAPPEAPNESAPPAEAAAAEPEAPQAPSAPVEASVPDAPSEPAPPVEAEDAAATPAPPARSSRRGAAKSPQPTTETPTPAADGAEQTPVAEAAEEAPTNA